MLQLKGSNYRRVLVSRKNSLIITLICLISFPYPMQETPSVFEEKKTECQNLKFWMNFVRRCIKVLQPKSETEQQKLRMRNLNHFTPFTFNN